ncbi:ThiF family adenylyltransferase [Pseudofrankia inefficax]|uniref:UBA/THIF-type NAD/FAD binding protein n=1 Tax=Pseudofrankia inefficax (strain DSM 45817 / CECT 9037 / DDB 130130 / EuI1c) TaxID=298654 RepID=E3IUW8_PSEI1|nr:ThiF family adenylyltransferase [Pseudofrankia inefficax]ADP78848.1 UBA/THIF-type NAD/FAD binding protein [Pseudofrankia inefficax]
MRPVLKPGLRRLWRDGSTLQLGVDPSRALVLPEVTPAHATALAALDGSRTHARLAQDEDPATVALVHLLGEAGLLDDATADGPDGLEAPGGPGRDLTGADRTGAREAALPPLSATERDRLRPDLAALSLATADPNGARRVLARRRLARVSVQGAGRVGAQVATLLAAAGVGHVVVDDAGLTGPADVAPGGLGLDDVGRPRAVATMAALARVARPSVLTGAAAPFRPDLLVLAPVGLPVLRPDESLGLERRAVPHLLAGVRETTGVVGPLVVPGLTACLHCQHLHRFAADAAWPLLALQLARRAEPGPDACEVTLATLVGALAAAQALAFLDAGPAIAGRFAGPGAAAPGSGEAVGRPVPATADGTLEIATPDWRIRRRTWPLHPDCPCRAARSATAPPASATTE